MVIQAKKAYAVAEQGLNLYIFCHIRTKQVIYSLSRVIDSRHALKQIPFLGKHTKPARIRKDLWQPLAKVTFPSNAQGLNAFHKLREFRIRHEHEWKPKAIPQRGFSSKKDLIMNQKANSIADLAAVLHEQFNLAAAHNAKATAYQQLVDDGKAFAHQRIADLSALMKRTDKSSLGAQRDEYKAQKAEKIRLKRALRMDDEERLIIVTAELRHRLSPNQNESLRLAKYVKRPTVQFVVDGIEVAWSDLLDAEYAKSWPSTIIHTSLTNRSTSFPITPIPSPNEAKASANNDSNMFDGADVHTTQLANVNDSSAQTFPIDPNRETNLIQRLTHRLKFGRS